MLAAVAGDAEAIVTSNVRDFPSELIPYPIHVVGPAAFAASTVSVSPDDALPAVEQMARRRRLPPRNSVKEVLEALQRTYHMDEAVDMIRSAADRRDG